ARAWRPCTCPRGRDNERENQKANDPRDQPLRHDVSPGCIAVCHFEKRFVKKPLTVFPNPTAPSRVLSHAVFAVGSAALPASVSFSPLYFAPSETVLPMPLAVSSTPSPTLPSEIFVAPLSTLFVGFLH